MTWLFRATCALLLTAASVGCGIRATDVPVDAGPAPSRATCDTESGGGEDDTLDVYLLCGSHVESVARPGDLPAGEDDRVAVAGALLDELQADPADTELAAGFTSEVPADLEVAGPRDDDPDPALRLSRGPADLTSAALVQIICTFAGDDRIAGTGRTVMLGGPANAAESEPRIYSCTNAMRTAPDAARSTMLPR
ncbi:hypothetical protein [Streptomyces marincola]|uniref:hypothetical protein n=1 Tax=Streptomyces marincola TaxID=2878388 RepID=UPI001CF3FD55|nr:hypothetical protein [Streptomyces marincola]UCM90004.1 hypothetical protein LC193_19765 [Streptomyces marincola]